MHDVGLRALTSYWRGYTPWKLVKNNWARRLCCGCIWFRQGAWSSCLRACDGSTRHVASTGELHDSCDYDVTSTEEAYESFADEETCELKTEDIG